MENILILIPKTWDVKKIRFVQFEITEPIIIDADLIESPLDDPNSLLNYHSKVIKLNGPSGFKHILDNTEGLDRERQMREDPPEWVT